MRPELVDASLRRKQEEKRRQEILDIQQEMGIQSVEDLESGESKAVTGMMQLHQGLLQADPGQQAVILQHQNAHSVIQAVQGLQEPLPRHLLSQGGGQLSPGSVGRKKVLLELRHSEAQRKAAGERPQPVQVMETQSPPLRQQTYYIFHPVTQTFEPITIAEFEENAVVEEVVVGDEPMEKIEEEDIAAEPECQEFSDEKKFVSQIENPRKRKRICVTEVDEERKPVMSPVVRETNSRAVHCEPRQEIKISRKESRNTNQTSVIRKLSNKFIKDNANVVKSNGTRLSPDLSRVIEETIGEKSSIEALVGKEENPRSHEAEINIEALVDVCFEEELYKADEPEEGQEDNVERAVELRAATLPLKKRRTNDNERFAMTSDVDIFSHKIVLFNFTTEESLRLEKLRDVLEILKNSNSNDKQLKEDSVKCLVSQVEDLKKPISFNSSLNSFIKCSTLIGQRQDLLIEKYLQVLGESVKTTVVLTLFSSNECARAVILLLKMVKSPHSPVSRNFHLLLYRYLSSIYAHSEAAHILREVQRILFNVKGKGLDV